MERKMGTRDHPLQIVHGIEPVPLDRDCAGQLIVEEISTQAKGVRMMIRPVEAIGRVSYRYRQFTKSEKGGRVPVNRLTSNRLWNGSLLVSRGRKGGRHESLTVRPRRSCPPFRGLCHSTDFVPLFCAPARVRSKEPAVWVKETHNSRRLVIPGNSGTCPLSWLLPIHLHAPFHVNTIRFVRRAQNHAHHFERGATRP